MFEKLTPREQKLALAVGFLLPVTVIFMGLFWFIGKYNDNSNQIMSLASQVETEEDRMQDAIKAERRRTYFNSISLSPEINDTTQAYTTWIKLLCEDVGLKLTTTTAGDASPLRFNRQDVGNRKTFTVIARGDLGQLTEFLTRFYAVDALHRINKLRVVPENETAGGEKKIRTGKLAINMQIEVLGLVNAETDRNFSDHPRELVRSVEEYQSTILRRNIFGPANNTPTLSARPRQSYDSGDEVKISLTAKDADEHDLLTFELIDPPFDGIELDHKTGDRRANLVIPGQTEGEYDFKMKIIDNGFPAKESIEEFTVAFKDAEVKEPKVTVEPPPFKHESQTRITGISLGKDGKWLAWITVRTTKENYRLRVGESFTLDEQDWFVDSITPKEVVLRVGDRRLVGRPNARERGVLKEIPTQEPDVSNDIVATKNSNALESHEKDDDGIIN